MMPVTVSTAVPGGDGPCAGGGILLHRGYHPRPYSQNCPRNTAGQLLRGHFFCGGLSGCQAGQMMPVTVSTAVPGVTVHAPVVGCCCAVAAGTVITPGTVENAPVTSL